MTIHVTPIPKLTEFATPNLTLTTANGGGASTATIRSDASLLVYDATVPDAITYGQSGAAGSASVSARRDHAHAMAANPTADISCRVKRTAVQVIADSTVTVLNFTAEDFDTDSMHDNSTNNNRLTCKTAGKYIGMANIQWENDNTGSRALWIRDEGANIIGNSRYGANSVAADNTDMSCTTGVLNLSVDDWIEVAVHQTSGGNLNISGNYQTNFSLIKVLG